MKHIALAFHNFTDVNGHFPRNVYDANGKPLLSWRVQLLPYLEQQTLYDQFHLDEPWDSPHNIRLSKTVLEVFTSPEGPGNGKTRYLALAAEDTIFPGDQELSFRDVTDGTSNTIMFVQAAPAAAVPWAKPQDLDFDKNRAFDRIELPNDLFGTAYVDGSCRRIHRDIGETALRALATRNGREVIEDVPFAR